MKKNKKIYILSVGRSDFLRQLSIIDNLKKEKKINYKLLISGSHSLNDFGKTINDIKKKKIIYSNCCPKKYYLKSNDISKNIVNCTNKINLIVNKEKPDIFIIFGDRYEMISGALACFGKKILIIHIHGGSITKGSFDDIIRHALTKLSHFHLTAIPQYAQRIKQMGEENFRVKVVGAPGLDYIYKLSRSLSDKKIKFFIKNKFILLCYHPETNYLNNLNRQIECLTDVVKKLDINFVITYPNSDPGSSIIIKKFKKLQNQFSNKILFLENTGDNFYFLLKKCEIFIGNSSSGIVEAASFNKLVLNIGVRQEGKLMPKNVICCKFNTKIIINLIKKNLIKKNLIIKKFKNPYGDGTAGKRIVKFLKKINLKDERNYNKNFITL